MKTRSIARGIVGAVASLLGVVAVGCSAETGEPEAAEIGSTAEALVANVPSSSPDYRVQDPAACSFYDATNSKEYTALFGGLIPGVSPTVTNRVLMAQDVPSGTPGAWVLQTDTLSVARHGAKAIRIDNTHCAIVGGTLANGNGSNAVEMFELTSGTPATIARSATITPTSMNSARSLHDVKTCVENNKTHLVAFYGESAPGTAVNSIEISDDVLATSWGSWTTALNGTRSAGLTDFGVAKEKSTRNYLLAGGNPSGSTYDDTLTFIALNSSCASPTLKEGAHATSNHATVVKLSKAVAGNVVFFEGTADTFLVNAGIEDNMGSPALSSIADKFVVSDYVNGYVTKSAGSALVTTTYKPTHLATNTAETKYTLIGGANAAISASISQVQEYTSGSGFASIGTLSPASYQSGAAFLPNNTKLTASTGIQLGTGLTGSVLEVTP